MREGKQSNLTRINWPYVMFPVTLLRVIDTGTDLIWTMAIKQDKRQ